MSPYSRAAPGRSQAHRSFFSQLDHRHRAEHVGGELPLQIIHGRFLQNAFLTVAGIVHQHIDWAGALLGIGDCSRHRVEVCDIHNASWVGSHHQPAEGSRCASQCWTRPNGCSATRPISRCGSWRTRPASASLPRSISSEARPRSCMPCLRLSRRAFVLDGRGVAGRGAPHQCAGDRSRLAGRLCRSAASRSIVTDARSGENSGRRIRRCARPSEEWRQAGHYLVRRDRIVADAHAAGVMDRVADRRTCAADPEFAHALGL